MVNPKVFLSHASEDKAFVTELATRLRSDGVEAWFDKWEIMVGDNLVRKIFDEGIAGCDVFLIILSFRSVEKPWVREEFDAAFVDALERNTKLIAVRIDDCAVPTVLKSRRWLNVQPSRGFDAEYGELLAAIFDLNSKPPLGAAPAYLQIRASGHTAEETAVWDLLVNLVATHRPACFRSQGIREALPGIDATRLREIVDLLEHDGIVLVQGYVGTEFDVQLTADGWYRRAGDVLRVDVADDVRMALSSIVCDGPCGGEELATRTGIDAARLMMAVKYLVWRGFAKCTEATGIGLGRYLYIQPTPTGRRAARDA